MQIGEKKLGLIFFESRDSRFGFNLIKGGAHRPHPVKNPWDRPEFREKMEKNVLPKFIAAGLSPTTRAASKAALNTPESKEKRSRATALQFSTLESRQVQSELLKHLHQNEIIHSSFMQGLNTANKNRSLKTHCKNGHEFSEKNTKVDENGWRYCKRCNANRISKKDRENRTHCLKGHEFTESNFFLNASNQRICLVCKSSRLCKRGHDLSKPESRYKGQRGCRLCKLARGLIYDAKRRAA